jgi:restriction endonuclease fold toxin 7 of polymorphic toxin system
MDDRESLEPWLRDAVRAELSGLREVFTGDVASLDAADGAARAAAAHSALAAIRRRDAGRVGRLGERIARVCSGKPRVPSLSGSARYRIPDILTETELLEVKNVARLRLTAQLRDFLAYAESTGRTFILVTRFDTVLAPDLQRLVDDGRIVHRHFPGLLSANGRAFLRRLIESTLELGTAAEATSTAEPQG